ncbi:MAG: alpha/beta hydrolase [Actinomycetota bacterium]|nr:alpha/beta hydrolase [Actinomycetota bacterium]
MAVRTRIFSAILKRISIPIDMVDAAGLPEVRARRQQLQSSRIGRFVFGAPLEDVAIEDRVVDLDGTDIRLRIYRPAASVATLPVATLPAATLPAAVNFHGGGWVQGNPEQSDWAMSRIAQRVGAVVVSVSYRLAPEHPFPAAVDDCWAATQWVHANAAELGADPERLAVMGDSAGGNLAAVVALLARDAGAPALRAQVLVYPGTEMYDKWPSEFRNANAAVLTSRNIRAFARIYLGEKYGTEEFRASPIRAESHAGLAPALIQTAELDPLLDNGSRYADKLRADGVEVTYTEYAGAIHGYLSLPGVVPVAVKALDEIVATLTDALKPL